MAAGAFRSRFVRYDSHFPIFCLPFTDDSCSFTGAMVPYTVRAPVW
jgi:hypothetical protein